MNTDRKTNNMKYLLIISLFIVSCNNHQDVKPSEYDSNSNVVFKNGKVIIDTSKKFTIRIADKSELDEMGVKQNGGFIGQENGWDISNGWGRVKKMGGLTNLTDKRYLSYSLLKNYKNKTYTISWGIYYDKTCIDADFSRNIKKENVDKEIIRLAVKANKMIGEIEDF